MAAQQDETTMVDTNGGDMILRITSDGTTRSFQVSSDILVRSSVVFKTMLGLRWKTASTNSSGGSYEQSLEDDDHAAMEIVLNCIHLNNALVPRGPELRLQTLFSLATIADKYDFRNALQFHADCWMTEFKDREGPSEKSPWPTKKNKLLFVSWVFRQTALFRSLTRDFVLNSRISETDGELIHGGFPKFESRMYDVPEGLIDRIKAGRIGVITAMLKVCDEYLRLFLTHHENYCASQQLLRHTDVILCRYGNLLTAPNCHRLTGGILMQQLGELGIFSKPQDSLDSNKIIGFMSACSIFRKLHNVSDDGVYIRMSHSRGEYEDHTMCSRIPEFRRAIEKVYSEFKGLDLT